MVKDVRFIGFIRMQKNMKHTLEWTHMMHVNLGWTNVLKSGILKRGVFRNPGAV